MRHCNIYIPSARHVCDADGMFLFGVSLAPVFLTIPLDEIEKGQRAMAIVELNSIWFVDGKFGVSLRLQQVMVEPSAKLPAFAFNT
jgi:hypothetical protein